MSENDSVRDDFPTCREAARRLGIGLRQIQSAHAAGELPVYQVGGWSRVRWTEALAWVESKRSPAIGDAHRDQSPT